jgi:hypothetical protein
MAGGNRDKSMAHKVPCFCTALSLDGGLAGAKFGRTILSGSCLAVAGWLGYAGYPLPPGRIPILTLVGV